MSYVYQLEVILPAEDPPDEVVASYYGVDNYGDPLNFRWPARRRYLSLPAAERQAKRLRRFGAAVAIHRSAQVVWLPDGLVPTNEAGTPLDEKSAIILSLLNQRDTLLKEVESFRSNGRKEHD